MVDLPEKVAGDGKRDWRTIVPGPGIELVVKDLRASMSSLEELATAHFASSLLPSDMLVPLPRGVSDGRPFPAFKIQFSVVEGGTIITFAMSRKDKWLFASIRCVLSHLLHFLQILRYSMSNSLLLVFLLLSLDVSIFEQRLTLQSSRFCC